MGGAPAYWRTADHDADSNAAFLDVWLNEFDAISPWTVGRYGTEEEADTFAETNMKGDVELLKRRQDEGKKKVEYLPVILPGSSVSSDLTHCLLTFSRQASGLQFVGGEMGV